MSEPYKKEYGQFLKDIVRKRRIKMIDVAAKSNISNPYLSDVVNGKCYPNSQNKKTPSPEYAEAIARATNLEPRLLELEIQQHLVAAGHSPSKPVKVDWDEEGNPMIEFLTESDAFKQVSEPEAMLLDYMETTKAGINELKNLILDSVPQATLLRYMELSQKTIELNQQTLEELKDIVTKSN